MLLKIVCFVQTIALVAISANYFFSSPVDVSTLDVSTLEASNHKTTDCSSYSANPTTMPVAAKASPPPLQNMSARVAEPSVNHSAATTSREAGLRSEPAVQTSVDQTKAATTVFNDEQIDHSWAPEFSHRLNVMFQQTDKLSHLKIDEIDCRSSVCRIQLQTDGEQSLSLGIKVGAALADAGLADNAYQFDAATENGALILFVGRDAQSFTIP